MQAGPPPSGLTALLGRLIPGAAARLSLVGGAQRLAGGVLDDAAAFIVAQAMYVILPKAAPDLFGGRGDDL